MRDYALGNKIYELRKKKNLTQEDIAILLDISDKSVSKWENGSSKPSIENLRKLSKILDISLDELLKIDQEEPKQIIKKVVLTGGPCAGKTTAMSWIENYFQKQGYKVIFIPETASELIGSGFTPWETKTNIDYQTIQMQLQLQKERLWEEGIKHLPNHKILIVCDRGLMDNKAYMTKKDFQYLINQLGTTETKLRDSYDAVFHLVSAAKGAKDCYNLDNKARTETIEDAIKLDNRLISAWTGHPHLRIIDNTTDFENKMKRLLKEISAVLGEPEPFEIERKFLIEKPNLEFLETLPNCEKVQIVQTYLTSEDNEEVRIRQRGQNGSYTYTKTRKIEISPIKRIEIEERLSTEEYIEELLNADPERGQIIKNRYCLSYDNQYFEIDIYPFMKDKAILEIELNDEKQKITFPDFLTIIEEVTDKEEYKNASLAKMLKKESN